MAQTCVFEQVLVHVGTNYLSRDDADPDDACEDIEHLLNAIKNLFKCKVVFSLVLPRVERDDALSGPYELNDRSYDLIEKVRYCNDELIAFCRHNNFETFHCQAFAMDIEDPAPKKYYLSKDGCHLNRNGVVELEHSVLEYIHTHFGVERFT